MKYSTTKQDLQITIAYLLNTDKTINIIINIVLQGFNLTSLLNNCTNSDFTRTVDSDIVGT